MANQLTQDLLQSITRACNERGLKESRFGRTVMGDPCFISDLRNGRNPTAKTLEKIYSWLAETPALDAN